MTQGMIVLCDEITAQLEAVLCRSLPQERSQIVIVRAFATALEVDEERITLSVKHDVAGLEITIHETLCRFGYQVLGEATEAGLQLHFVELQFCGFQKAVFEVVEVKEHIVLIEFRLWIAVVPVQADGPADLQVRQLAYCALQQFFLRQVVSPACLTSAADSLEERCAAQVGLQIVHLVIADGQHTGYWQFALREMAVKVHKGVVLVLAGAKHSDHGFAV